MVENSGVRMMQLSLIEPASRANDPVTSHVACIDGVGMAERHRNISRRWHSLREATIDELAKVTRLTSA